MRIIRNVSWSLFANLIVAMTKWLVLVFIANLLSPVEVGVYSLAFAISAPITLFANMKLRSLYITDETPNYRDYTFGRNIITLFALLILFLIGLFVYYDYSSILILVGLSKIFDLQSDMYYALPHKEKDMGLIGKLMIVKHLLIILGFSLSLFISKDLVFSLLVQLIIQILFLYLVEKKVIKLKFKYNDNPLSIKHMKKILLLGIPLGFVQMVVSLNTSLPRYFLEFFESAEVLGYFSAIAYLMTIGNIMMSSISQNFLPILYEKIKRKQFKAFRKIVFINLFLFTLLLGVVLTIGSFLFGGTFLSLIYGPEYAHYSDILVLMSFATAISFISWNFDTALLSMRYISIQPKITVFILFINIFISYYFINKYGIKGATYTLVLINSIQLLLRVYFVEKRLKNLSAKNEMDLENIKRLI